jgi:hypothetical protein
MVPYRVFVAGLSCDIAVYSTLKSDCVAVGDYRGKHIKVSEELTLLAPLTPGPGQQRDFPGEWSYPMPRDV